MEWMAGLLGCIGSIILAWPMLSDVGDRQHWDKMRSLHQRTTDQIAKQELREYRDVFLDERMGNYGRFRRITILGFSTLAIAFFLLFLSKVLEA